MTSTPGGGVAHIQRPALPGGKPQAESIHRILGAEDTGALLRAVLRDGLAGTDITAAALYLSDDNGWLRQAASEGTHLELLDSYQVIAPDSPLPASVAVRELRTVHSDGAGHGSVEIERDAPAVEYVSVPAHLDDQRLGVVTYHRDPAGPLDEDTDGVLRAVTALCSHRLAYLLARHEQPADAGAGQLPHTVRMLARRDRAARMELAMAGTNLGSFDWDFDSGRLVWDEQLSWLFGIDPARFDERVATFYTAVHPADRAALDEAVRDSRTSGRFHATFRIMRRDNGELRWLRTEGRVMYDAGGEAQGIVGVSYDRTQEHRFNQRRQRHREFVLRVTRGFAAAQTTQDVVDTMAETVLPDMGGWRLTLFVQRRRGRGMDLLAARGYEPGQVPRLHQLGELSETLPLFTTIRRNGPVFIESREQYVRWFPDPLMTPLEGENAWVLLPLDTADGLVGACSMSFPTPRPFSPVDRTTFLAIAGILAQALARARLFDARRLQMTELQRLMLPHGVPELPGLHLSVRYVPGSEELEVGGDWYDALRLDDGRSYVVIGDVQGHNAQAAAVMGQLRTAMRAHAREGQDIDGLMRRANQVLWELDTEVFATCCIVELDPARDRLRMVRAGHPYPLLREPDGTVRELRGPGGVPLGCFPDDEYPVLHDRLPPGALLFLYTDGLVERPDQAYDTSVTELVDRLGSWQQDPERHQRLERLSDSILAPALSPHQEDDIATLLVHRPEG
ncbi:SpoIIE family protein phosphatase [Streptomyces sp. NPDC005438]|uniref:SpoIIE family protein phosphatase n=1 Tax=Streptomyces sp. NPDC005438 TaxID=3156880 RepID=UPI0033AFB320